VSWPLARELAMPLEVPAAGGRMLVDTGDTVGCVVAVSGVWEPSITALVPRLLARGDVAVDVGAHVGYYTLLASRLVGDRGHVYALEPSPARYRELVANVARNGISNVTTFQLAAGADESVATLFEAPRTNTSASTIVPRAAADLAAAGERVDVRVAPVQDLVAREDIPRVRLIKVDVEGSEVDALRGLDRILARGSRLALLVEISPHWSDESPRFVEELCRSHHLQPWLVRNDYTVAAYFPSRPEPPVRIDTIPDHRADLVLTRGIDLGSRA
jgi:FkbM family methyltransferase